MRFVDNYASNKNAQFISLFVSVMGLYCAQQSLYRGEYTQQVSMRAEIAINFYSGLTIFSLKRMA